MFPSKILNCAGTVVLAMAGIQSAAIGSDRSAVAAAGVSPPPKITYQGRLTNSGMALNALADFEYTIWSAEVGGTQLANVGIGGIPVDDGIFTAKLDFGAGAISGGEMWMEIKVCHPAGSCTLEPLTPRQEITASPQAVRAIEGAGPQGVVEVSADTGNVGIGVADPVAKLEVDGDVKSSGPMTSSTALIVDTTTQLARAENGDLVLSEAAIAGLGSYVQLLGDGSSDVDIAICNRPGLGCHHIFDDAFDDNALKLESATELAINIQSPANEVMRITNSRVGIGTSVPSAILDLESSGSTTDLHINNTAADGDPTIRFQLSGTSLFSMGVDDSDGDKFKIGTGTPETGTRLTIDGAGSVGIGTTTPGAKLDVHTTEGVGVSSAVALLRLGWSDTGFDQLVGMGSKISFFAANDNNLGGSAEAASISSYKESGTEGDISTALLFTTNNNQSVNEAMRITSTGDVGIGTTTPNANLEVFGDRLRLVDVDNAHLQIAHSTTNMWTWRAKSDGKFDLNVATYDGSAYGTSGSTLLTVEATGNVGIGTTSPSAILDLESSGSTTDLHINNTAADGDPTIRFQLSGTGVFSMGVDDSDGDKFKIGTGAPQTNTRLTIDSSGNVGIGTTSPSAKTHINAGSSQALRIDNSGFALLGSTIIAENTNAGGIAAWLRNDSTDATLVLGNEGSGPTLKAFTPGGAGVALQVESEGCVGVGLEPACGNISSQTNARLHVRQNSSFPDGPSMYAALFEGGTHNVVARFDRQGSDGVIIQLAQAGIAEGSISVSGNTVSYNAFTGSHYGWIEGPVERGALMTMTGDNRVYHDREEGEVIYGVRPSTTPNDARCLGAYLALQESTLPESSSNPHQIMAVGNGDMWVVDSGMPIQPGDYLISSDVAGHAMLDDPHRFPVGYVVARAAEPVDWSAVAEAVDGRKHKKISVFFESFERGNSVAVKGIVERQQQEIDELRSRIESLESASSLSSIRAGLPYALIGLIGLTAFRRRRTGEDR